MHSQNREEKFILEYFGDFVGTFLDLGSNDGITLSNTYALSQKGWKGYLVEGSPKAFERLWDTYPAVSFGDKGGYMGNDSIRLLNYVVGSHDGEIVLHESGELLGKGDVALVSSTKESEVKRWNSLNIPFNDVVVPCRTFKTLQKYMWDKIFHFVTIDIEGMEKEVVPQINFKELGTRMAIIEFNGTDEEFFTDYMNQFGFKMIHKNGENLIFAL